MTPPPATMSGRCADRITSAARATAAGSGGVRGTCQTRSRNSSAGQSYASACTSCGSARVTAPVSAGSVSTRIAASSADGSCSGRQMRSKNRDTGRNASLTLMSWPDGSSSCCSTGSATRVAKTSPGSSSTGSRLMVASAAPVTMFVAPGPIDDVQASVDIRFRVRANAAAACTMACSLRPCRYFRPAVVPQLRLQQALAQARPRCRARRCRSSPR